MWCLEVARGSKQDHSFISMMDPFLFDKFESVWDDSIVIFGRMSIRKDEISGNEIYDFFVRSAREYSETWASRINDLKEPLFLNCLSVYVFLIIGI